MASSPPLPAEEQTDEDFFDRLVEDEFGVLDSDEGCAKLNQSFFSMDLANERTQLEDSVSTRPAAIEEAELEHRTMQAHPLLTVGSEGTTSVEFSNVFAGAGESKATVFEEKAGEVGPTGSIGMQSGMRSADSTEGQSGRVKCTGVKEVQWSAFSIDSQQFNSGGVESFSDFLLENSDVSTNQVKMNGDIGSSFMEIPDHGRDLVFSEQKDNFFNETTNVHSSNSNDPNYWENLYPGWKFDAGTGQWLQVNDNDATANAYTANYHESNLNVQEGIKDYLGVDNGFTTDKNINVSYSQHSSSLMVGEVTEDCKTSTVSSWNHNSLGSNGYPPNMVFDPQYPGWYFDTNTQEWYQLDAYTQSLQQISSSGQGKTDCNGSIAEGSSCSYGDVGPLEQNAIQNNGYQNMAHSWDTFTDNIAQHSNHQSDANAYINKNKLNFIDSKVQEMNYPSSQAGFNSWDAVQSSGFNNNKGSTGFQNFVSTESTHQFNHLTVEQSLHSQLSQSSYANEKSFNYNEQQFQNTSFSHYSYAGNAVRSSSGRPPHALVTFGFGGKLIVMKDPNTSGMKIGFNNQDSSEASVSILNLLDVIKDQPDATCDYIPFLSRHPFPGPLVGGNTATKDVYRWIDESIAHCESPLVDPKKAKAVKLLLSLLKISFQHYGKLRSPFGSGTSVEENDGPESAATKLFASARANGHNFTPCVQSIPSESHAQATSIEMQNLLVSGKRKEALHCAQTGQLWGPALVLAAQLGDKYYVDTVKQMAQHLLVCGSPLRTLCLLIAGQPADVFSTDASSNISFSGNANSYELPSKFNSMLDDWEENLAIITANRTKDDELVVIHLGDCLWKERGEVTAAHTCYLVAEANFEQYSDSARLCLIGADHWKYPRTYASPDAIQRTELYEYAKVMGNSQFVLLPFQPYKLIYANMLAEIGKTSDSLRYCQASMKLLRNSSRTPEVEMWKSLLSSLEERLCGHQQGGFGENLAPAKLVGKLFTSIDRSIHRMMGAPSSLPPIPQVSANGKESQVVAPKVVNSQSTMVMSSLIPSASVEGMNEWTGDAGRKSLHSRSISEPDFGRTPKQGASNDSSAGDAHNKTLPSRFGRIGSQFFQKTIGWVSRSRSDRQARLGESNKFYYDEKLKRWVEEGAEPPAEQLSLQAPPKVASFQNGTSEYNINNALKNPSIAVNSGLETKSPISSQSSAIPPISASPNQFSARRMGVRSRYVDTFNKGSDSPANSFHLSSTPAIKPAAGAKFFVPASPAASNETATPLNTELSFDSPLPPPSPSSAIESFPSMNNTDPYKNIDATAASQNRNDSTSHSRAASWGGSWDVGNVEFGKSNPSPAGVSPPPSFFPANRLHSSSSLQHFNGSGGTLGEDLDEVELS